MKTINFQLFIQKGRQTLSLSKGYTLIELLVVIAVIGILASVTIAAVNPLRNINQAKDSDTKSDISSISTALQTHYTNSGTSGTSTYPNSISGLIPGELKVEPKMYDGSSYSIELNPPGCLGTDSSPCTDVAIYGALLSPVTTGSVWCFRSSTETITESSVTACTAP